jgi:TctA family transporter
LLPAKQFCVAGCRRFCVVCFDALKKTILNVWVMQLFGKIVLFDGAGKNPTWSIVIGFVLVPLYQLPIAIRLISSAQKY